MSNKRDDHSSAWAHISGIIFMVGTIIIMILMIVPHKHLVEIIKALR